MAASNGSRRSRSGSAPASRSSGKSATATKPAAVAVTAEPRKTPAKPRSRARKALKQAVTVPIAHELVEHRAYEIWRAQGCPEGASMANWIEAERQLRKEMSVG